jgi:uncharacterized protein (TIGR03546 family)
VTLLLKQIFNFLKLLNSDKGTNSIAWGVVMGMILGFTPAFSLQTLLVILLLFFFRIQIGAALGAAFFFKLLAFPLDPAFDAVGARVLEAPALQGLFTTLYNLPLIPLTRFNNSIVMGSGVVALLLAVPVFFGSRILIAAYRHQVVQRFQATPAWKAFTATTLYQWYTKYEALRGN